MNLIEQFEGHISIPKSLWDYIPYRSRCKIIKAGDGTREERFRYGGKLVMRGEADGEPTLLLSWGSGSVKLKYSDIDEIWKRYDDGAFVELHMIAASLLQKKQQIDDINRRLPGGDVVEKIQRLESDHGGELIRLGKIVSRQAEQITQLRAEIARMAALEERLRDLVSRLGG